MNAKTAAVQGSGWGWLGWYKGTKKLEIVTTPNQDPLLCKSQSGSVGIDDVAHVPIIGIDIWEHAFYLQYKNVKPDVSLLRDPLGSVVEEVAVSQSYLGGHQLRRGLH